MVLSPSCCQRLVVLTRVIVRGLEVTTDIYLVVWVQRAWTPFGHNLSQIWNSGLGRWLRG